MAGLAKLAAVATPAVAVTMVWISEGSVIVPLLKTFGMSNQDVSLVTIAGPLTGMFIAPIIGEWSDKTRSCLGRRVPYIVSGALFSVVFQQLISHAIDIAEAAGGSNGGQMSPETREVGKYITMLGFIFMYISTNVIMMPHRALVADIAGEEQTLAHALVSIMDTCGGLLVTGFSSVLNPTVYIKEFMGMATSIMCLSVVVCVALAGAEDAKATQALSQAHAAQADQAPQAEEVVVDDAAAYGCQTGPGKSKSPGRTLPRCLPKLPDTLTEIRHLPKAAWPVVLAFLFWNITSSTFGSFWVAFAAETVLGGEADGADICGETGGCSPGQLIYNDGVVEANRAALIGSCLALVTACLLPVLVSPRCKLGMRPVFVCTTFFIGAAIASSVLYRTLTISSSSALYVVWRGVAGGAAGVLPYAVVGEVVGRECPEKLGLFLGTLNIFNVWGQVRSSRNPTASPLSTPPAP